MSLKTKTGTQKDFWLLEEEIIYPRFQIIKWILNRQDYTPASPYIEQICQIYILHYITSKRGRGGGGGPNIAQYVNSDEHLHLSECPNFSNGFQSCFCLSDFQALSYWREWVIPFLVVSCCKSGFKFAAVWGWPASMQVLISTCFTTSRLHSPHFPNNWPELLQPAFDNGSNSEIKMQCAKKGPRQFVKQERFQASN